MNGEMRRENGTKISSKNYLEHKGTMDRAIIACIDLALDNLESDR